MNVNQCTETANINLIYLIGCINYYNLMKWTFYLSNRF